MALLYNNFEAQVLSAEEEVVGLPLTCVPEICFVPVTDSGCSFLLCFCATDSPLSRNALAAQPQGQWLPHQNTAVVGYTVVNRQWEECPVAFDLPRSLAPSGGEARCVIPLGVHHLTVASTFDFCAVMHGLHVYVWCLKAPEPGRGPRGVAMEHALTVSIAPGPNPLLPTAAVSPMAPPTAGAPAAPMDAAHVILATPKYLLVGGCGCVAVYPLPPPAELVRRSDPVEGAAAEAVRVSGAGAPGAASQAKHPPDFSVCFGDPCPEDVVRDMRAINSSKIVVLSARNTLCLINIYYPFKANACVRLTTPEPVKAFDVMPAYLNLLYHIGTVALCYIDHTNNVHFTQLKTAMDRSEQQHLQSQPKDQDISVTDPAHYEAALSPTQSVFHFQRVTALAALIPNFVFVADVERVTLFVLGHAP